jgi:hypothetical protein
VAKKIIGRSSSKGRAQVVDRDNFRAALDGCIRAMMMETIVSMRPHGQGHGFVSKRVFPITVWDKCVVDMQVFIEPRTQRSTRNCVGGDVE